METFKVILEILVVGAIFMGVRAGGLGLGMWGGLGTAVLVFVFYLAPGSPPTSAMLIIIAVITAAASMQAAGGIDYQVELASKIIGKNPKQITLVAPLVSYAFTVGSGTSNIFVPLIPVIYYQTAYDNGVRPERPLAASTVASALGITSSPVSAAMAAMLTLEHEAPAASRAGGLAGACDVEQLERLVKLKEAGSVSEKDLVMLKARIVQK